jgi:hypothetical protein
MLMNRNSARAVSKIPQRDEGTPRAHPTVTADSQRTWTNKFVTQELADMTSFSVSVLLKHAAAFS